ncbi:hypothetical protein J1N35_016331 [Gossypium stocksii]|uniref:Uncharacterized protein n=1 Tax=Gossypium stocksii TaxID=47602 RepID=A0A9D3VKF7_9ROSI|nr:hypothetical protein J1N35_016331 [Gossypium stocksii]
MERRRRKCKIEEQIQIDSAIDDNETPIFEPDLVRAIFKQIWIRKAQEREGIGSQNTDAMDSEIGAGTSKKIRPTFGNLFQIQNNPIHLIAFTWEFKRKW